MAADWGNMAMEGVGGVHVRMCMCDEVRFN